MIPDGEKLISKYLRAYPALEALGVRVVGKTPDNTVTPWIRVTQLDAPQGGIPDHLIAFVFQLDCYAGKTGGQPEASLVQRTVREALTEIAGEHDEGIASGAQINLAPRVIDPNFTPPRERFALDVTVWAHA